MAWADLDYTIEIPDQPCWSQKNDPSQGGKEAGTRQPVVILLGWGGCRDKNLAKYSAIYHERKPCTYGHGDCLLCSRHTLRPLFILFTPSGMFSIYQDLKSTFFLILLQSRVSKIPLIPEPLWSTSCLAQCGKYSLKIWFPILQILSGGCTLLRYLYILYMCPFLGVYPNSCYSHLLPLSLSLTRPKSSRVSRVTHCCDLSTVQQSWPGSEQVLYNLPQQYWQHYSMRPWGPVPE
ncbi:transmembrane protein 53 isoform X2 [Sciurus carolinensis]|uniref:transmembrane protein 53 isoform X2 n=1 Tax=Sciurus carolinensis TaxID=30640 RepID=UPI001FB35404|nr:transmembrane protein 53 isoform X2 [Sciurus carolinensis]